MQPIEEIEFHDAQILQVHQDFVSATVEIKLLAYPSPASPKRVSVTASFHGVTFLSQVADFEALSDNRAAGNINYWVPVAGPGKSYVYLVNGCIAIHASSASVEFEQNAT